MSAAKYPTLTLTTPTRRAWAVGAGREAKPPTQLPSQQGGSPAKPGKASSGERVEKGVVGGCCVLVLSSVELLTLKTMRLCNCLK